MACFRPLDAAREIGSSSKPVIYAFGRRPSPLASGWEALQLPCGQCIGCRLDRSQSFAIRCMHEARMHDRNCFITLTYDGKNLPTDGSLVKWHFQDFMKRLRRSLEPTRIRFFHCGEYGDRLGRPHYHACIFGYDFPDRELFSVRDDVRLYTSEFLAERWSHGFCTVGDFTFDTAAYVARYCLKKVNGKAAFEHYVNENGVLLTPEYCTMSRRPGIGADWFAKFGDDVFPWDEVIHEGRPIRPPRYYFDKYQLEDLEGSERVKAVRLEKAIRMAKDSTPARLRARETVKKAQFKQLKRGYENDSEGV